MIPPPENLRPPTNQPRKRFASCCGLCRRSVVLVESVLTAADPGVSRLVDAPHLCRFSRPHLTEAATGCHVQTAQSVIRAIDVFASVLSSKSSCPTGGT